MRTFSISLTVIIAGLMIYIETLIPSAPKEYVTGYDIPEGIDPDKPIVVNGIKFNPKYIYSKNEDVRKTLKWQMERAKRPLTPRRYHSSRLQVPALSSKEEAYFIKAFTEQHALIGRKIDFVLDSKGKILYEDFEIRGYNDNGPFIKTSNEQTFRLEFWRLNEESKAKLGYDKKLEELWLKKKAFQKNWKDERRRRY